jgi:hypothetical protein
MDAINTMVKKLIRDNKDGLTEEDINSIQKKLQYDPTAYESPTRHVWPREGTQPNKIFSPLGSGRLALKQTL